MQKLKQIPSIFAHVILLLAVFAYLIACFGPVRPGQAYIGDFSTTDFNDGWTYSIGETSNKVTLPSRIETAPGTTVVFTNTLPENVHDGMNLSFRVHMKNVRIYVDNELRSEYSSEKIGNFSKYTVSAYIFASLYDTDAGKPVRIEYVTVRDTNERYDTVSIGYGNNAWFNIIRENLAVAIVALLLLILGVITILAFLPIRRLIHINRSVLYLAQCSTVTGLWVLSESRLRQLYFASPTLNTIVAYVCIEIVAAFVLLYFDEVLEHRHSKVFITVALLSEIQMIINIILNFTQVAFFHTTLIFSHLWIGVALVAGVSILMIERKTGDIKKYSITCCGMMLFMVCVAIEVINYYFSARSTLGVFVCLGLALMLCATMIQALRDEYANLVAARKRQEAASRATIETIASAIDAKDEYTGGHSLRVASYAAILAENVADKYNFTHEDVERIRYVGQLHDIGKIGVPDVVLNKPGRLTPEEFRLMKMHTVIGDYLLNYIDTIPGLTDGASGHHERWDGMGYPNRLKGEEIPVIARILCIADAYDAMTSNRVYRKRLSDEDVRKEIIKCAGTQFDPYLAEKFAELLEAGTIKPLTNGGFSADEEGHKLKSATVQKMLLSPADYSGAMEVNNPAFIRMMAYIVKLAERNSFLVELVLFSIESADDSEMTPEKTAKGADIMERGVAGTLRSTDITTAYSASERLVAFVNLKENSLPIIINRIMKSFAEEDTEHEFKLNYHKIDELDSEEEKSE